MINLSSSGSYKKTENLLSLLSNQKSFYSDLNRYGELGVIALSKATPKDSTLTSKSWGYEILSGKTGPAIMWYNTHIDDGQNVAILIQYGHGTGTGGYVVGRDYINPAMLPIFDKIAAEISKKVTNG